MDRSSTSMNIEFCTSSALRTLKSLREDSKGKIEFSLITGFDRSIDSIDVRANW